MSRKSKKRHSSRKMIVNEEKDEFMLSTKVSIKSELDEAPSLEQHGFWIYPSQVYKDIRPKTRYMIASEMTIPTEKLTASTSFIDMNQVNRSHSYSPTYIQPTGCLCYCFCHQWYSCPCFYVGFQTYQQMTQTLENNQINNQTSKRPKIKPRSRESSLANAMDEELEINTKKDIELASLYVNDAKHNFDEAMKEYKKK